MTHTITPRDRHFNFSAMSKAWLNSNPYITHMFNAPSMCLPHMEGLVNYIVKQSLDKITDKQLHEDCLNFITQEMLHAREHNKYNLQLNKLGYESNSIVEKLKNKLRHIKNKWSLLSVLAVGISFECLTASIGKTVIEDNVLQNADTTMKQFWQWHMMEELEHKSVLFNLYQHLGGGYWRRITIYTLMAFNYCYYSLRIYLRFIKKDQLSSRKGFIFVINRQSFFRKSLLKSLAFYLPRYHPDKTNTNHLICLDDTAPQDNHMGSGEYNG